MNSDLIPVIVTTEFRGVFFGLIDPSTVKCETVILEECRNVLYWESKLKGFLGLSSFGPTENCKIGFKAGGPVVLNKITSVAQCSTEAAEKWNNLP